MKKYTGKCPCAFYRTGELYYMNLIRVLIFYDRIKLYHVSAVDRKFGAGRIFCVRR